MLEQDRTGSEVELNFLEQREAAKDSERMKPGRLSVKFLFIISLAGFRILETHLLVCL